MELVLTFLLISALVLYSLVMCVVTLTMYEEYEYSYPRVFNFKLKHILLFIVAPHSVIFISVLVGIKYTWVAMRESRQYSYFIDFINKDLF